MFTKTDKTARQIRQDFFDYFVEREHTLVPSAPVVPADDPTLLFTNAGMNQFKDVFLATGTRNYRRAVDTQKCIRVSGKHNDLEQVGRDTYHHTYFEMLGNWSFGDYFKADAIAWAWDLLTRVWGLPKERLYATVFAGDEGDGLPFDDEAERLWRTATDIDPAHVLRFGKKDNFWEMADTGPCGPNSEIHVDLTEDGSGASLVNADDPRVMEIWNLVFIQFNRTAGGVLQPLPAQHVDTGMGFERLVAVLQCTDNYGIDLFTPLMDRIGDLVGQRYAAAEAEQQVAFRVVADHVRMLSFSIADGALPSNEGRGYVLRRLLRRAARYGRLLDMAEPFVHRLVPTVAEIYAAQFPEVAARADYIGEVIKAEEASFGRTLGRGLEIFSGIVQQTTAGGGSAVPGGEAFRLYDTYGFPLDLTRVLAEERGLGVDEAGFDAAMQEQRERARRAGKFAAVGIEASEWVDVQVSIAAGTPTATVSVEAVSAAEAEEAPRVQRFVGYEQLEVTTRVFRWAVKDGRCHVVLAETPFYAEAGGQVGDRGAITVGAGDGALTLTVEDTQRDGDFTICRCPLPEGVAAGELADAAWGEPVTAAVDTARRGPTTANHTATHLLHMALRRILGDHVHQAGSLVAPDHLRFDFTHWQRVEPEQLGEIERIVNGAVCGDHPVDYFTTAFDAAQRLGAMALFGEKYGDEVRVVRVGGAERPVSLELCGGCHVRRTGQIGPFVITSEGSIASGVRRIEARTGGAALAVVQEQRAALQQVSALLGGAAGEAAQRAEELVQHARQLEKRVKALEAEQSAQQAKRLAAAAEEVGGVRLILHTFEDEQPAALKNLAERLRTAAPSTVAFLVSTLGGRLAIACAVSDDLATAKPGISAAVLAKEAAAKAGGGGGGKPTLATAGARAAANLDAVLETVRTHVAQGAGR